MDYFQFIYPIGPPIHRRGYQRVSSQRGKKPGSAWKRTRPGLCPCVFSGSYKKPVRGGWGVPFVYFFIGSGCCAR